MYSSIQAESQLIIDHGNSVTLLVQNKTIYDNDQKQATNFSGGVLYGQYTFYGFDMGGALGNLASYGFGAGGALTNVFCECLIR